MKNGELESDVIVEENSIENAMVSSLADLIDTERNKVNSSHQSQHLVT
jgi:hypothetical protein